MSDGPGHGGPGNDFGHGHYKQSSRLDSDHGYQEWVTDWALKWIEHILNSTPVHTGFDRKKNQRAQKNCVASKNIEVLFIILRFLGSEKCTTLLQMLQT